MIPAVLSAALLFGSAEACTDPGPDRAALSIVDKYYPELSRTGLKPQEIIDFEKSLSIPTKILNYTDIKLDKNVLGAIYQYFERYQKRSSRQSKTARVQFFVWFWIWFGICG